VYKDLEGARTKPTGWEDAEAGKRESMRSITLFDERLALPALQEVNVNVIHLDGALSAQRVLASSHCAEENPAGARV
jgi:uncharacterized lipoprotein YbaY